MRYVRFAPEPGLPADESRAQWGRLDGEKITPLPAAPWLLDDPEHAVLEGAPRAQISTVQLLVPVAPRKIVCVGRNYADHAAETGSDLPPEPLLFLKPSSALLAPGAPVVYPSISQRVDHEAEIAVVIGPVIKGGRFLDEAEAMQCVFGYTPVNDVTARDLQNSDGQWSRAKGFDTFLPVGPWVESGLDPENRRIRCLVNGETRQDANTSQMIFHIPRILSHISMAMRLEPGDLICTGTPAGISPVFPGDLMVVEIEGLGALSNPVISEAEIRG
jgi:2-keto-4-pentenoate hydratase/2-oxohepta-3-ene-1,7-dioic acid hydratase in catechol pathway